jgi:hypothetical protein
MATHVNSGWREGGRRMARVCWEEAGRVLDRVKLFSPSLTYTDLDSQRSEDRSPPHPPSPHHSSLIHSEVSWPRQTFSRPAKIFDLKAVLP